MQVKFLLSVILLVFCFLPIPIIAQQESTSILVNTIPSNPNPGENVNITLSSYAENLDIATITWFVDGKSILSGTGEKSLSLRAPNLGSETKVVARIKTISEETQVSTIIKPSQMVLLWEAVDSYVPPFYKGKALPAPDTFVKVVALPEIRVGSTQIDPKNLSYAWQKEFDNVPYASGYGKNYFTFKNDYLENSNTIGVTAFTTNQASSSSGRLEVQMYLPILNFYKQDSKLGILWDNILENGYPMINNDIIISAPYFISPKDVRSPDLVYTWYINEVPVSIPSHKKTYLPIQIEDTSYGTSDIKLKIESVDKIFQTVSKSINVNF